MRAFSAAHAWPFSSRPGLLVPNIEVFDSGLISARNVLYSAPWKERITWATRPTGHRESDIRQARRIRHEQQSIRGLANTHKAMEKAALSHGPRLGYPPPPRVGRQGRGVQKWYGATWITRKKVSSTVPLDGHSFVRLERTGELYSPCTCSAMGKASRSSMYLG